MSVKTSRHFTPTKDVVTATSPREQQIRALCEANGVTAAQREAAEAEVAGTRANMLLNRFSEERLKAVVARMSSGLPLTGAQIVEFFDTIMARTPGGYRPKRVAAAVGSTEPGAPYVADSS